MCIVSYCNILYIVLLVIGRDVLPLLLLRHCHDRVNSCCCCYYFVKSAELFIETSVMMIIMLLEMLIMIMMMILGRSETAAVLLTN